MNEIEKKEIERIRRSVNPKTKVRKCYKIEEDGTKTTVRVVDLGYKAVFHCEEGPALINKDEEQIIHNATICSSGNLNSNFEYLREYVNGY